jgi:SAM-dependent methyltransferase
VATARRLVSRTPDDKRIERDRYDRFALTVLASENLGGLEAEGAEGVPEAIRTPYLAYEELIRRLVAPGTRVLDVCGGNGRHSLVGARLGARVTVSDIAPGNLQLAAKRGERAGLRIAACAADAEMLPFRADSFDVVTCAGSLSYVDIQRFLSELRRVLRPGGAFVFVDSLNHNPVYRLNRFVHYLRGDRSKSTLLRMPTERTLEVIRLSFPDLQVQYFGTLAFLAPLLRPLGTRRARHALDWADRTLRVLRRYAFKVVAAGHC